MEPVPADVRGKELGGSGQKFGKFLAPVFCVPTHNPAMGPPDDW